MNRDVLKQIIIDQKEMYLGNPLISRDYDLEENVNYCFVGIRRTGKSYMMYQQIHNLMNDGISSSQIVYVNFEDERLLEIGVDDLNTILELGIEFSGSKGKPYLFLDEVGTIATNLRELKMISVCVLYRSFNFFVGEDDVYILMLP